MKYPNRQQVALLFDTKVNVLDQVVHDFQRIEEMKSGTVFNVPEVKPGVFYRLFDGPSELMLTFEYIAAPANPEVFRAALSSPVTGLLCPDIREIIMRSESHILMEVSHGVLGGVEDDPKIASFLSAIEMPTKGNSQAEFERRLSILALMSRVVTDHASPSAVHWTQSDMLVGGDKFDALAAMDAPSMLHIHPFLYRDEILAADEEEPRLGICTFGARHWIGREVVIRPSVIPWFSNFETILAFLRVATMENGYVIPDGETFGPEDRTSSTRVLHHESLEGVPEIGGPVPLYELVPLKHVEHGFLSEDHVPDENVIDDRAFPAELMPDDQDDKMQVANEWSRSRKLAEGVGGKFEVRAKDHTGSGGDEPPPPPKPAPQTVIAPAPSKPGAPSLSGRGLRSKVFGRKGL